MLHRDVYLLDDPLSAVDPQVGQQMFERCIRNELRSKTVLFVTHQLQFLSRCDQVIFMERGRVLDQGDHDTLMKRNPQYLSLIQTFNRDADANDDAGSDTTGDISGHGSGGAGLCSALVDDTSSSEDEMFSIALVPHLFFPSSFRPERQGILKNSPYNPCRIAKQFLSSFKKNPFKWIINSGSLRVPENCSQ